MKLSDVMPLARYASHLSPLMVGGRIRQGAVRRYVERPIFNRPAANNRDWVRALRTPELRELSRVYGHLSDRFVGSTGSFFDGRFVSNEIEHSFGPLESARWGEVIKEFPTHTRWEHDFAFFWFAPALVREHGSDGMEIVAKLVQALDKQTGERGGPLEGFHWSPIAIAFRVLSLLGAANELRESDADNARAMMAVLGVHIERCGRLLSVNVERYLGYNHAITTEVGLLAARLAAGRNGHLRVTSRHLSRVLRKGILRDGMWAERSPSYHVHMLLALDALRASKVFDGQFAKALDEWADRMRRALDAVIHPDGEIALFNDSAISDAVEPEIVRVPAGDRPKRVVLPEGGYARLAGAATVVIMDAGPMGPNDVIGHGHADFLSIEMSLGTRRFIVDHGVESTSAGPGRVRTRSSDSHNGPTYGGLEPAEFFGAWRVGRRGTARFTSSLRETASGWQIDAEADGYVNAAGMVRRSCAVNDQGHVSIVDSWEGATTHQRRVSFLIPSTWKLQPARGSSLVFAHMDGGDRVQLEVEGAASVEISGDANYFPRGSSWPTRATAVTLTAVGTIMTTTLVPLAADPED